MANTPQQLDLNLLREQAEGSLYFFTKGILGYDWLVPHVHGSVCKALSDFSTNCKLIVLPRGWLKTTICSIAYPIWLSIRNPNIRILIVQNSATNAMKKLGVIRTQWENNELLRALYPNLLPNANSVWKAESICLSRSSSFPESTYEAAGTSTRVVSRHYDVVIEDDTVAPDFDELGDESLAPTAENVEKAIGWHRTNLLPLLNNPQKDISLVVGTRWYDKDLIRWVTDNEPHYNIITRACRENDLGEPDPRGKITYPERFNDETLRRLEVTLGPYMYNCLYMNTPVRKDDMMFKPEWIKYYDVSPQPKDLAIYTTFDSATDPALSQSKDTDYSVVLTAGKDRQTGEIYVLDYFRERCNAGAMASAILAHVRRYRPVLVGYQDVTFERSIDFWLKTLMRQNETFFMLERLPVSRQRDAKNRLIAGLQPLFASSSIYLRPHMKELVNELLTFPLGSHDDIVDTLAMQLGLWKATPSTRETRRASVIDNMTVEGAKREILARSRTKAQSPTLDANTASSHRPLAFTGDYF